MSRATRPRVLVVGDVIDDLIVHPHGPIRPDTDTPATIEPRPGGSGANQAAWLAEAGLTVRFVGRVGARDVARHAAELTRLGVEPVLIADDERPTGTIVVLVGDDATRTMLTDRGANLGLTAADLPDALLDDVDHLHLSGYALFEPGVRTAVLDLVHRAVARGIPWSVDPSSTGFLADVGVPAFLAWTTGAALLLPNLDEGRALTGLEEPEAVAAALTAHAPLVALKLAADGALVARRGGPVERVAAPSVVVVDPTGAGDAFAAGFLAALLTGRTPRDAAAAGTALGARAVTTTGARPRHDPPASGTV